MKSDLPDRNGARRRRFWSSDEKRRMVAESFARGASVSEVAQRYGVNANLLFTWRRQNARSAARGGAEPFELLPVRVSDEKRVPAAPVEASARVLVGRMEIVLAAGERILVGADVDTAALARVVKALSRR